MAILLKTTIVGVRSERINLESRSYSEKLKEDVSEKNGSRLETEIQNTTRKIGSEKYKLMSTKDLLHSK